MMHTREYCKTLLKHLDWVRCRGADQEEADSAQVEADSAQVEAELEQEELSLKQMEPCLEQEAAAHEILA